MWICNESSNLAIWAGLYFLMRYDFLDMDTLINLMSQYEFTSKGISLVESHPDVSKSLFYYVIVELFTIILFCSWVIVRIVKWLYCSDPIRTFLTLIYARHVLRKNYLSVALSNLEVENAKVKKAISEKKPIDLKSEEEQNPKLKANRIITIKGKDNSSVSL